MDFRGLESAFVTFFVVLVIVSAIGGWALIEGLIWVFHHIHISVGATK